MVESATDAYTRGYNEGRRDEAEFRTNGGGSLFKTPDVTPAQMVAVAGAIVAVAAAFGFDLTQQQQDAVMQLVSIVAGLLIAGDAVVRHGRATGNAKKGD
jgi:hypothetical protein